MARFFWWAGTGSAFACHLPVASIEPPKERKRLLGPGDNLPGAFHFVQLDEPKRDPHRGWGQAKRLPLKAAAVERS